jgi:glucosyl-3-phosphoglycerate phosphatase
MTHRLLLIRHGESTWNAEHRLQGQADPPLSPLGRDQAAALLPFLADSAARRLSSGLTRAV